MKTAIMLILTAIAVASCNAPDKCPAFDGYRFAVPAPACH
jgi:hypothetical protein